MKVTSNYFLQVSHLRVPRVILYEVSTPPIVTHFCSWSQDTNIEDLHSNLINKIELELSEERTRIESSPDPALRGDPGLHLLISGVENFLAQHKPSGEDELVEFCILMKLKFRYYWASLGHFSLYGVKASQSKAVFLANNYCIRELRVPRTGIGLSDKREVFYGEISFVDFDKVLIGHGLDTIGLDFVSCEETLKSARGLVGQIYLAQVDL